VALEVAGPVTFTGDQAGGREELESFTVQHNEHKISLADRFSQNDRLSLIISREKWTSQEKPP
jgi:hypothetical protein